MAYLDKDQIEELRTLREAGRKSLYFLCTRILGYRDVDPVIHKPFIDPLDELVAECSGTDIIRPNGECLYVPDNETLSTAISMDIKRRYMLQAFRGSLKTTINTQAHLIQLLLNFPHLAALIYHNTEDKAKMILKEIIDHFSVNEMMHQIYPEFCVPTTAKRRAAISNGGFAFTSPARALVPSVHPPKKEPTFAAVGLGSSQAGQHVSVIKMTDVVEETNTGTPQMRQKVFNNIHMAMNLLEDPLCLVFIEGTPYDPDDGYSRIVQQEWHDTPRIDRSWHFTFLPVYEINTKGKARTYDPDELSRPWLKAHEDIHWSPYATTRKGEYIPVWPVWRDGAPKFSNKELEQKRRANPYIFACQQLLKPASEDASVLPPSKCFHRFPADQLFKLDEQLRIMAVDTAETLDERYSNDTAMSVAIVTDQLLRVITRGFVGMIEAEEILDLLFDMYEESQPHIIFVEDTSYVRGLKSVIREREQRKGYTLPIEYLSRKSNKKMRIRAALRSPMLARRLMFSSDLPDTYVERVMFEMSGFPRAKQDDVLDTLADICAANSDLESYTNPHLAEVAQTKARQDAYKADFQQWADTIMGRAVPPENDPFNRGRNYGF